ncbi:MAG TPA: DUF72 domain-containing protein [Candidatus Dormibacteraeota bacterium]|nr:DUF72 domain-containing protein [Candidatus Dormibacteraeota bacterium]
MLHIGTSGWQYRHWRETFYPRKLAQRAWLEYYAERFHTAEVNSTFYNLPPASVFEQWAARTPSDFVFALKMSRFLTHLRRLRNPEQPVELFLERARELGAKRGPTLLQLPPSLKADAGLLDAALAAFPPGERIAVELRHPSWFVPDVRSVLERRGAPLCLADRGGIRSPEWATAGWGYVRFHMGRAHPPSCYGPAALETWAERIARVWPGPADVFVYFNNDAFACAIRDAIVMARICAGHGLNTTRVPPAGDVALGAA